MIDIDNTTFDSSFSGLANTDTITTTFAMSSQSLTGNQVKIVGTPSITLDNSNSISSIEVNFGNVETVWRPIFGYLQHTVVISGTDNYDIACLVKYVGTTLTITLIIADDTGLSNTISAIDFNFTINTYNAPF